MILPSPHDAFQSPERYSVTLADTCQTPVAASSTHFQGKRTFMERQLSSKTSRPGAQLVHGRRTAGLRFWLRRASQCCKSVRPGPV